MNLQSVRETKSDFPAVTVCNLNPFDIVTNKYAAKYIINTFQSNKISPLIVPTDNQTAINLVKIASTILKAYVLADNNLNASNLSRESLGFTMSTMLISCYFNGIQCSASDFYLYETFDYGNCYTFNGLKNSDGSSAPLKETTKTGPNTGLVLELFLGVPGKQDFYTYKTGAYVLVHNSSTKPLVQYDGMNVQTGTANNIKVSRSISYKLSEPYSSCRSDLTVQSSDSIYFKMASNYTDYDQKLCYDFYRQINIAIAFCGCNDPSLPLALNINEYICKNQSGIDCCNAFKGNTSVIISESDCPYRCDSFTFETNIDSAAYPSSYYSQILSSQTSIQNKFQLSNSFQPSKTTMAPGRKKRNSNQQINKRIKKDAVQSSTNVSSTQIAESFVMINVFYSDLGYTLYEESAALDVITFMGIIGILILNQIF